MPIPIPTRHYQATHQEQFLLDYACKKCGFTGEAEVLGIGHGAGSSPMFIRNDEAREEASYEAWAGSARNARTMIKLCPCPRCGRRDLMAVATFILGNLVLMALASAFFVALAAYFFSSHASNEGWLFLIISAVIVISLYVFVVHPKWWGWKRRIRFLPKGETSEVKQK